MHDLAVVLRSWPEHESEVELVWWGDVVRKGELAGFHISEIVIFLGDGLGAKLFEARRAEVGVGLGEGLDDGSGH